MKKNLTVNELLSECQTFTNRKVNIVATINDNNFSAIYGQFDICSSKGIDWYDNQYIRLGDNSNDDNVALIKVDDIKSIVLDTSKLGEQFDVYAIECNGLTVELCLGEGAVQPDKCVFCDRELRIEDKCFRVEGTGSYYSEGLDGVEVKGWICSDCLSKIMKNKTISNQGNEKGLSSDQTEKVLIQ